MVRVKPLPGGPRAWCRIPTAWSRACRARWLPCPWFFGLEEQAAGRRPCSRVDGARELAAKEDHAFPLVETRARRRTVAQLGSHPARACLGAVTSMKMDDLGL